MPLAERTAFEQEIDRLREYEARCIDVEGSKRQPVADTKATPHKWVCLIEMYVAGSSTPSYGSGLLIGPRRVVTAAHNIWEKDVEIKKVRVRPGMRALWSTGPERVSYNRWILPGYRQGKTGASDLGLIELDGDVTYKKGPGLNLRYFGDPGPRKLAVAMGLNPPSNRIGIPASLTQLQITGMTVKTIGYPGDRRDSYDAMYEAEGVIRHLDRKTGVAIVEIDACKGQSGSPVFLDYDNDRWLIGVLVEINIKASNAIVAVLNDARVKALLQGPLNPLFTGPLPVRDEG